MPDDPPTLWPESRGDRRAATRAARRRTHWSADEIAAADALIARWNALFAHRPGAYGAYVTAANRAAIIAVLRQIADLPPPERPSLLDIAAALRAYAGCQRNRELGGGHGRWTRLSPWFSDAGLERITHHLTQLERLPQGQRAGDLRAQLAALRAVEQPPAAPRAPAGAPRAAAAPPPGAAPSARHPLAPTADRAVRRLRGLRASRWYAALERAAGRRLTLAASLRIDYAETVQTCPRPALAATLERAMQADLAAVERAAGLDGATRDRLATQLAQAIDAAGEHPTPAVRRRLEQTAALLLAAADGGK